MMRPTSFLWFLYLAFTSGLVNHRLKFQYRHHRKRTSNLKAAPAQFFTQKVDHFCATCTETFQQRFFVNETFHKPGGPVFLCVGGEGPAFTGMEVVSSIHCNVMVEFAPKVNALLVALEHRYYGDSVPVPDLTLPNMRYLSHTQALADLADFVSQFGLEEGVADAKWISFGGSYPGMMAGWSRLKFPHLIHGSVASSAPVQAQVDYIGYMDVVSDSLSAEIVGGSKLCRDRIAEGHQEIGTMLQTAEGQIQLLNKFHFCAGESLATKELQNNFAGSGTIAIDIQGNDPSCAEPLSNIEKICDIMAINGSTPVDTLVRISDKQNYGECLSIKPGPDPVLNTTLGEDSWIRVWTYQTCAEFAFYQTCEVGSKCPWTQGLMDLESFMSECKTAFNITADQVYDNVAFSNAISGGNQPSGSRVLWPNGSIDPWYNLSVINNVPENQQKLWVEGASHHFWTHPSKPTDSQLVNDARQSIRDTVSKWLQEEKDSGPSINSAHPLSLM